MIVISFITALFAALILTPVAKLLAAKFNILDQPGQRKIHKKPIPLMGGVAVFLSFALALWFAGLAAKELLGIMGFGLIFILFGLLDDAGIEIHARYKIWSHLLFALLFVYLTGIRFNFLHYEWINWVLTACFITFMTNSMNMLDGMDGLVSGICLIASGSFVVLAYNSGQSELILVAVAVMGATLGFLRYNFNPASIFLGEAGATFLGFIMAVMAIKLNVYSLWNIALSLGIERLQIISFIVPLIILGIPIFDTYFVFANRFLHDIKFSQPGKDHSHHRIHLMGFSQRATVLTLYAIQVILGSLALAMVRADLQQFFSLLMIVAVFFLGFTIFLSRVEVYHSTGNNNA